MTKFITVETQRHHDDDKVLTIKATAQGQTYFDPFDTTQPEVEAHRRAALAALIATGSGDFELIGYGELTDPTHLVFIFQHV